MSDTETSDAETGVSITLNGRRVEASDGELVIAAAERAGVYIPRFCYHPRMESVGMCRMCLVEIDTGRGPALQVSCMVPVAEDMVVETDTEATKKAQDGVLEFLLANHPLDCPVCDKGGECPLQDQAYAYGPGESRFVEEKRHFAKPIPISDLVHLDRERCILCDRCTRFADDVAGDTLIVFQDRGVQTEVNTFPGHPFASYFSGNTVQICPVGALLASPYRFKARPWDLENAETTCTSCSVGCRMVANTSRNQVLRYQGVDVDPVNWGWLCDRGRFGFEAIHSDQRLSQPLVRSGSGLVEAGWAQAYRAAADALSGDPRRIAVLGGARLTNESAYAWSKLAKGVIRTDHVDAQLGDGLAAEAVLGLPRATIDQVMAPGGGILLLGVDTKEEVPVLFLRLRHAVVKDGATLVEIVPAATGSSELATTTLIARPGETPALVREALADGGPLAGEGPLHVIYGRGNLAESPEVMLAALGEIRDRRPDALFLPALRRGNVFGALDAGLAPGLLPGRATLDDGIPLTWPAIPERRGMDAEAILAAAAEGELDTIVLLGADPIADARDRDLAERALATVANLVAVDTFLTDSSRGADVVLASTMPTEEPGTTTNLEGRISRVTQKVTPPGTARADWVIAADLAHRLGTDLGLESAEQILAEMAEVGPCYAHLDPELIGPDGTVLPVPVPDPQPEPDTGEPARGTDPEAAEAAAEAQAADEPEAQGAAEAEAETEQAEAEAEEAEAEVEEAEPGEQAGDSVEKGGESLRRPAARAAVTFDPPTFRARPFDAYKRALVTTRRLYDDATELRHSPSMRHLAPGGCLRLHPRDFEALGIQAGQPLRVSSAKGSLTVPAEPSTGVAPGTVTLAFNQPEALASRLIDATAVVVEVSVETV